MGLIDRLRKAEEQGRGTARRGLEKARERWDDAERRLRRKMRLHPKPLKPAGPLPEPVSPPSSSSAAVAKAALSHRASEEDAA